MTTNNTAGVTLIPRCRLLFPTLFEAKPFLRNGKPQGEPVFSASFVIEPAAVLEFEDGRKLTLDDVKKLVATVARAKWPGRDLKELALPFKSGESEANAALARANKAGKNWGEDRVAFYRRNIVLKTSSKFKPFVVGVDGKDVIEASVAYNGVFCTAEINFVAYDRINPDAKDGVKAYLNGIRVLGGGERIGGRDGASAFAGIKGGKSDFDPTGGDNTILNNVDDETPF
jgi:hypothetical protein